MQATDAIRDKIPEAARDLALNLQSVLTQGSLDPEQRWGVAVASAITAGNAALLDAVMTDARASVSEAVLEDARAAAALMAMNNVYYRFRHMVGKESYAQKPARLRMTRIAKPLAGKANFELVCLAVSAINGCEVCIRAHEAAVLSAGLTEEQVHDAVRIAATIRGAAVALGA